ncbi:MarR family winged helix-turn-helix transcriptional regulator [Pectinatus haikarae]|uniref:MarR family winged helix-turn-helix transcriptional regulator n=1 Tax=Pectinatus haikarae TaxID=349096 RepID=UPI0018C6D23C|nr:MarR family transcriptional regulator [Pectinatus haikarae]
MIIITIHSSNTPQSDDLLIHCLYQATRVFSKSLNNAISNLGIYNSEWSVLKTVKEHEAVSQSEIASYLDIEPAAISKTLAKLEKKGSIRRCRLNNNKEKNILLTDTALSVYPELAAAVEKHRNQALTGLSSADRQLLAGLLRKIYKNITEGDK